MKHKSRRTKTPALPDVSLDEARKRCEREIKKAYEEKGNYLVDALPAMGKSRSAVKVPAETDTQTTILTTRGRKEQYGQISEWCEKFGLIHKVLPSAREECPVMNGETERGKETRDAMLGTMGWYDVSAREIHNCRDLPCQENGKCPYELAWDIQFDKYDVLIGHYLHAYVGDIVEDRTVVFDEFPNQAYITEVNRLSENITEFVQQEPGIRYQYYDEIGGPGEIREKTYFADGFRERDTSALVSDNITYHPLTPLATYAHMWAGDLGNGWKWAELGYGRVAVRRRGENKMHIMIPPDVRKADCVVALDGTPSRMLWERMLNISLNVRGVLDKEERAAYLRDTQDIDVVQVSDSLHPYLSGTYVEPEKDAALLREIERKHGVEPAVITSQAALEELQERDVNISDSSTYYGNVRGSNDLGDEEVGVVLGSPEPSSKDVKRMSAIMGASAACDGNGLDKDYGFFGNEVLEQRREAEVLQSIFRFSRDGSGATVYLKTGAIPDWVPRKQVGGVRKRSEAERDVFEAVSQLGRTEVTGRKEIQNMSGHRSSTVRENLRRLRQEGVVRKVSDNRGAEWGPDGIDEADETFGVDIDESDANSVYNIHSTRYGNGSFGIPKVAQEKWGVERRRYRERNRSETLRESSA